MREDMRHEAKSDLNHSVERRDVNVKNERKE